MPVESLESRNESVWQHSVLCLVLDVRASWTLMVGRDLDGFQIQYHAQGTNLLHTSNDHLACNQTCLGTLYLIKQPGPSLNGSNNCNKFTILYERNLFSSGAEICSCKLHSLDTFCSVGPYETKYNSSSTEQLYRCWKQQSWKPFLLQAKLPQYPPLFLLWPFLDHFLS